MVIILFCTFHFGFIICHYNYSEYCRVWRSYWFDLIVFVFADCSFVTIFVIIGEIYSVCRNSCEIIKNVKKLVRSGNIWERRLYASCPPLNFVISEVEFVEAMTPMGFLNLAVALVVVVRE